MLANQRMLHLNVPVFQKGGAFELRGSFPRARGSSLRAVQSYEHNCNIDFAIIPLRTPRARVHPYQLRQLVIVPDSSLARVRKTREATYNFQMTMICK